MPKKYEIYFEPEEKYEIELPADRCPECVAEQKVLHDEIKFLRKELKKVGSEAKKANNIQELKELKEEGNYLKNELKKVESELRNVENVSKKIEKEYKRQIYRPVEKKRQYLRPRVLVPQYKQALAKLNREYLEKIKSKKLRLKR